MNKIVNNRRTFIWVMGGLILFGVVASLAMLWTWFFPKQGCAPPTLTLGTKQFVIKTIQPKSDGSLKVPVNQEDAVFWVEGTDTNQVFALSPTSNNLALKTSLNTGDAIIITRANCNSTTYTLTSFQEGTPGLTALLDQSVSEITVFIQPDSSTVGFTAKGELAAETITTFNTPDSSEMLAEISLLETTASADGKTIRVGVSILNSGQAPITLTANDISLADKNSAPLPPVSTEPALPMEIKAGASETIYFVFPRPLSKTATLKIFSVEYDLEGY